jgi:hypothetical protein
MSQSRSRSRTEILSDISMYESYRKAAKKREEYDVASSYTTTINALHTELRQAP